MDAEETARDRPRRTRAAVTRDSALAFAEATQNVGGDLTTTPHGGRAVATGRRSDPSLYDFGLATYDTGDTSDQSLSKGFIEIFGLSGKIAAKREQTR